MALLITLDLQRKQLNKTEDQLELNREELMLTREELRKAADAQVDSVKGMSEQLKTQFLQQFDSLFFSLLSGIAQKINLMHKNKVIDNLHKDIYKMQFEVEVWSKKDYRTLLELIYCLVEQIEKSWSYQQFFDQCEVVSHKNKYMAILRSSLDDKIMHFIMHDCLRDIDNPLLDARKAMIEKYAFFQNLTYEGMEYPLKYWLLKAFTQFEEKTFEQNVSYQKFKVSNLFNLFKARDLGSIEWFIIDDLTKQDLLNEDLCFVSQDINLKFESKYDSLDFDMRLNGCLFRDFCLKNNSLVLEFKEGFDPLSPRTAGNLYLVFDVNKSDKNLNSCFLSKVQF